MPLILCSKSLVIVTRPVVSARTALLLLLLLLLVVTPRWLLFSGFVSMYILWSLHLVHFRASVESTATTAVQGTELALLTCTARVVDAMALTCAENYTCRCKETYLLYNGCYKRNWDGLRRSRLARLKSSQFYRPLRTASVHPSI